MCSYQPDTLTVRASFSVPSKTGVFPPKEDNATDRESRRRSFRMVGKEALLLKKELEFENLSDEQLVNISNGVNGFTGDISEVLKEGGVNDNENSKPMNATFDRLVYDAQLTSNESKKKNIFFINCE